jgi:hypothetical protein
MTKPGAKAMPAAWMKGYVFLKPRMFFPDIAAVFMAMCRKKHFFL